MSHMFITSLVAILLMSFIMACGAPFKRADKVSSIFQNAEQIDDKYRGLCEILSKRTKNPTLVGLDLAQAACSQPKLDAMNYDANKKTISFTDIKKERITKDGANFISIQTTTELWIPTPVLEFANLVFGGLSEKTLGVQKNGGGTSKNQDLGIQVLGEPRFDAKTNEFELNILMKSSREQTGVVDIENELKVEGQLFDNKYVAFTVTAIGDTPREKSLIQKSKLIGMVFFHSGIVRFDLMSHFVFHSFGVDAVMEKEIVKALESSLKSIPDLFHSLQ
jgi:hypothetical protein